MWFLVALLLGCAFLVSLWYNVVCYVPIAMRSPHRGLMKVGVVLGSGGHTSEMLRVITELPFSYWSDTRPFYVASATDLHSASLASELEQRRFERRVIVHTIPRAREVGQSYLTSIITTLRATVACFRLICTERPDVLLTNGPGVCVPVIAAAVCVASCAPWWYARPTIVYMESFTCVSHLSLTGRLLAPWLADVFTVHWRALEKAVAQRRRRGMLVHVGSEEARATNGAAHSLPSLSAEQEAYALVTVGSTKFSSLVQRMVQPDVCTVLHRRFGIKRLYVQHGTAEVIVPPEATFLPPPLTASGADASNPTQRWSCGGLIVEAFSYRPHLDTVIRGAALIITHAGAGTILEGLQAQRPLVVVPNRELMSDHQLELAEALAAGGFLFCVQVAELAERLPLLDVTNLQPHSGMDAAQLKEALRLVLTGHSAGEGRAKTA
ncbi:glycosyltransferase family 28 protein, putative [Leishmania tarentolae]|uniref:UDP-N-acetylglucosamine transferase subunit ALG14 n=1 Tax=Leishmania tarentolae TaxID=5689 RepID=A0A640KMR4_LEITA|nr:glycosyltransferase family 28 protein, putative [Leishmania tarentolae]